MIEFVNERLLQAGIWLWNNLNISSHSISEQLPELFHQYRKIQALGRSERHVLSECVYQIMRYKTWFEFSTRTLTNPDKNRCLQLLSFASVAYQNTGQWHEFLAKIVTVEEAKWLEQQFQLRLNDNQFASKQFPVWLIKKWQESLADEEQVSQLCHSLLQRSPVDIRINTLKTNAKSLRKELAQLEVSVSPAPYSKNGLRMEKFSNLTQLEEQGYLHIQDAGSQLICELMQVARNQVVVDLCAGTGGKSLTLAQNMHNSGVIYACDTSAFRLAKLKQRAQLQGVSNCYNLAVENERDKRLDFLTAKADRVLVDAPCSCTGILSRKPEIKWHLSPGKIADFVQLQLSILTQAVKMLKQTGSLLVYATCSLLPEENEKVVRAHIQKPSSN